jgi:hypothetical protein
VGERECWPCYAAGMLAQHARRWGLLAAVLLAVPVLHIATLFPGVGGRINGGDSAKFQFIGTVLGVSHPPGNPLYLLLNALWVRLPWPCSPATAASLLSWLFGALTLFLVARALALQLGKPGQSAACFAALGLGLGPSFWTLATEAEVYTLNTCLLAASCAAALRFTRTYERRALLTCAGSALLGCANHLTSLALLPAIAWLIWSARSTPGRLRGRDALILLAIALLAISLYAYVPIRALQGAPYSELVGTVSARGVFDYLTARGAQSQFWSGSLEHIALARVPAFARELQKQWAWPLFALIAFGLVQLRRSAPGFAVFVLLGSAAFALVALGYDIPDPSGFYLPVATLLAFPLGAAFAQLSLRRASSLLAIALFAVCVGWSGLEHLQRFERATHRGLIYSIGHQRRILLDLDDLFARIPEGARFALPCDAYGCVQLFNYYRFADPVVARRRIAFVRLPGYDSPFLPFAPTPTVPWKQTGDSIVCTLRAGEAGRMRREGATVHTVERPAQRIAGKDYPGVPFHCACPESSADCSSLVSASPSSGRP